MVCWSAHTKTLQVLFAHDFLAEEVASTPKFDKVVQAAVDGGEWAWIYRKHEVMTREPPPHSTASVRVPGRSSLLAHGLVSWRLDLEPGDGAPQTRHVSQRVSRLVLGVARHPVFGVAALPLGRGTLPTDMPRRLLLAGRGLPQRHRRPVPVCVGGSNGWLITCGQNSLALVLVRAHNSRTWQERHDLANQHPLVWSAVPARPRSGQDKCLQVLLAQTLLALSKTCLEGRSDGFFRHSRT